MNDPLVSVVVTVYNLGWCIDETLQSVFNQTYRNIEIIVVDDASTDDTQQRMERYAGRIKYIRHATNQGVLNNAEAGPARNTGVRAASGAYIAILDGDDLWEPEKIAVQVEAARRFPNAGLILADGVSFAHEDGRILRSTLLFDSKSQFISTLADGATVDVDLYEGFLHGCLVDTPSQVLIAAPVFDAVGLFSECSGDDYEFYIRASAKFACVVVKKSLVRYRQHHANLSGASGDQFLRWVQPNINIWKHHLQDCRPDARPIINRQIARTLALAADKTVAEAGAGDSTQAREYLWTTLRNNLGSVAAPYIAYQLLLLICPAAVATALNPVTRRARRLLA